MPNSVPTLRDFAAAITLAENTVNSTPQLLDADVSFSDPDDNFDGGTLVVAGLLAEDRVSIRDQGAGAGLIQFDSGTGAVSFGGIEIGTAAGGVGGTLTITFNASATSPAIEALIENLTYANVSDAPTASRNLTVEVTDATGAGTRGAPVGFTPHPSNPPLNANTGFNVAPAFGDLDGDGDLDIVMGDYYGHLFTITNTGTAATPVFGAPVEIAGIGVSWRAAPALGDLDGDGDLDIVVGGQDGLLFTITNTGTAATPVFDAPVQIAGIDVGWDATPALGDLDGDGNLDIVVGEGHGRLFTITNTGTAFGAPVQIGTIDIGMWSTSALGDLDGDGDLDIVAGNEPGRLYAITNNGTAETAVFGAPVRIAEIDVGDWSAPALGDLDGDGDLDIVAGNSGAQLLTLIGSSDPRITVNVTAENDAPSLSVNAGLTLNEGARGTVTATMLDYDDAEQADDAITYTLDTTTANGTLWRDANGNGALDSGEELTAGETFTQADIGAGRLRYTHDGGETTSDGFQFDVSDGAGGNVNNQSFAITATPVNDTPVLAGNAGLTLAEGAGGTITAALLDFDDVDNADAEITYTLDTTTANGTLWLDANGNDARDAGEELIASESFSQADIGAGRLRYSHNGGDTTSDGFRFDVSDGAGGSVADQSFAITVTPVNDPAPGVNAGLTLDEGARGIVTAALLDFDDVDNTDAEITYTLDTTTANGTLWLDANDNGARDAGEQLTAGESFTQADIGAGRLRYTHNGGEATSDGFQFDVSDGAGGLTANQSFAVTVTPVNDAPTLTGFEPSVTLLENTVNATPQLLDADVSFSDPDNNFDGGTLVVAGLLAEDRVSIRDQGAGAGLIQFNSGTGAVSFGGTQIGTAAGGAGGTLTVTFNASATSPAIEALIENLTYANVSDAPTASRTLTVEVTDAAGVGTRGAALGFTHHPSNPLAGIDVGYSSTAALGDLDGDGDLDIVVGDDFGQLFTITNTGTAATPAFGAPVQIAGIDVGLTSAPAFGDLDGDGDLDIVVGDYDGRLFTITNTGTAATPVFGAPVQIAGIDVGSRSTPALGDLDGDGDLDIVVGDFNGHLSTITNTGTAATPAFDAPVQVADIDVGYFSTPALGDLDGDGDLDIVAGDLHGRLFTIANTGTATTPGFGAPVQIGGIDVGSRSTPALGDLDGDGDLDIVAGNVDGQLLTFIGSSDPRIGVGVTAENDAPVQAANAGLTLNEGARGTVAAAMLDYDDAEQADDAITYTIDTTTANGTLWLDANDNGALDAGEELAATEIFTQADIGVGRLRYTHNGGEATSDGFQFDVSDGAGGLTENQSFAITVTPVNDAPSLTGFAPSVTLLENTVNATPQLLDADVTFIDPDNNFTGGTLVVAGLLAEDRISIRDQGAGAGLIQFNAGTGAVSFGGVAVGTATGGIGGTLTVTFNASATSAAIEALIENLTYANVSDAPTASRTLTVDVTDAAGAGTHGAALGFTAHASDPLAGIDVGYSSTPAFGDLDGDGDLDIVVGNKEGRLLTITNTGTAAAPVFGAPVQIGGIDVGSYSSPALGDIDGDGDVDIIAGNSSGDLFTITNTGTAATPAFGAPVRAGNGMGPRTIPALGDLDGDGDLDIVVGDFNGHLSTITNTGTAATPVFGTPVQIAGIDVDTFSAPTLGDLDGDGDLDIVVGKSHGWLFTITNTGTAAAPVFGAPVNIGSIDVGFYATPALGDLDGDGDLDIVSGEFDGDLLTFIGSSDPRITVNVTAENDAPVPAANAGLTLNEGASGTISASLLDYDDAEQADSAVTYTLDTTATRGTLWLDANNNGTLQAGEELTTGESFTQADIGAGRLRYKHNGSETTTDTFQFDIADGAGGSVLNQSFAISVIPVNDAPAGTNKTVTTKEDVAYTLKAADFGFSDVMDHNGFAGVRI